MDLSRERILVLGAGGWFGRTFLDLLSECSPGAVLAMTRESRRIEVQGRTWKLVNTDSRGIAAFAPTVIANFAFLTREREQEMGTAAYIEANQRLTETFLNALSLSSVRRALTVSSGASVSEPESTYGRLKREEEERVQSAARHGLAVVIGRAYSVSGPYVQRPTDYAFSDLILQAPTKRMSISSRRLVYRRYVSVRDFLRILLANAEGEGVAVIESGGEIVEMAELAARISKVLSMPTRIDRNSLGSEEPSVYASDNQSWERACKHSGIEPEGLDSQIRSTARALIGWTPRLGLG